MGCSGGTIVEPQHGDDNRCEILRHRQPARSRPERPGADLRFLQIGPKRGRQILDRARQPDAPLREARLYDGEVVLTREALHFLDVVRCGAARGRERLTREVRPSRRQLRGSLHSSLAAAFAARAPAPVRGRRMTVTSIRSFGSTAPVTLAWGSGFFSLPGMMVRFRGAAMTSLLQKADDVHSERVTPLRARSNGAYRRISWARQLLRSTAERDWLAGCVFWPARAFLTSLLN